MLQTTSAMFRLRNRVIRLSKCSLPLVCFMFLIVSNIPSAFCAVTTVNLDTCEVCVTVVRRFDLILTEEVRVTPSKIEDGFKEFCKDTKGKENRFCYYIGGMPDSATYILGEMSKPLSSYMPAEKVCEKLAKLDSEICKLKYEKQIDLETVEIKKLKVKDLKKILDNWGESCDGCLEKTDFIKMIEELKPKYAAPKREEL